MKTCPHLEPLEKELALKNIPLGEPATGPYGPMAGKWCECDCVFDADSLRKRLGLPHCVEYTEYDGRVAGSDATFFCKECKRAIMGRYPTYAVPLTANLA